MDYTKKTKPELLEIIRKLELRMSDLERIELKSDITVHRAQYLAYREPLGCAIHQRTS